MKILKKDGWFIWKQGKGSHVKLKHPIKTEVLLVADHGSAERNNEKYIQKSRHQKWIGSVRQTEPAGSEGRSTSLTDGQNNVREQK